MNKGYVKGRGREVSLTAECYWIIHFEGILHSRRWKDVWIIYCKETEESLWNTRKQTASSHWDTKETPELTQRILYKLLPDDPICMKKVDLIFIRIFYYLFEDTRDTILEEEEEEGHLTLRGKKRSNLMFVTPQVHNNPESELFYF